MGQDENLERFVRLMSQLRGIRLRAGAIGWNLYRDISDPHGLTEVVRFATWDDHVAMRRRLDDGSYAILRSLFAVDDTGSPFSRHLVSVDPRVSTDWELLLEAHDAFRSAGDTLPLAGTETKGEPPAG